MSRLSGAVLATGTSFASCAGTNKGQTWPRQTPARLLTKDTFHLLPPDSSRETGHDARFRILCGAGCLCGLYVPPTPGHCAVAGFSEQAAAPPLIINPRARRPGKYPICIPAADKFAQIPCLLQQAPEQITDHAREKKQPPPWSWRPLPCPTGSTTP